MHLRKTILPVSLAFIFSILSTGCSTIHDPNSRSKAIVDSEVLRSHVVMLSSNLYPLNYQNKANLAKAASYIRAEFEKTGATVSNQTYLIDDTPFDNVTALFPGMKPDRIVIGAHYDTCDSTPGADDNASGVAGLIELAHLLAKTNTQYTVELVAYCTEEPPFFATEYMGSANHAKSLHDAGIKVKAMLALEMIGYFSDQKKSQSYPSILLSLFYPSKGNYIAVIGNTGQRKLTKRTATAMIAATDLPVEKASVPSSIPGVDFSDHRSYWEYGYPAVMITDTAFLRNKMYHESGDTADRLDYKRMSKVVTGVYEAVIRME